LTCHRGVLAIMRPRQQAVRSALACCGRSNAGAAAVSPGCRHRAIASLSSLDRLSSAGPVDGRIAFIDRGM
jgi:hypothetical protein